ncbi:hypothetical protein ACU4GI_21560 [Cupriavidus basilensis]
MTPEEIVSRIHPKDRTQALAAFVAINRMDYVGMSEIERHIVRLSHYTQLHDFLLAKANASVVKDQAE